MDKNFYKKIKNFKIFLLDNFNIIDNNIIKRNRKIDFKHIIYTCFNKFINHTSYDIEVGELNKKSYIIIYYGLLFVNGLYYYFV